MDYIEILKSKLNSKSRKRDDVNKKMAVAKILHDDGFRVNIIAEIIKKDRTTILWYLKQFDNCMRYPDFRTVYADMQELCLVNNEKKSIFEY